MGAAADSIGNANNAAPLIAGDLIPLFGPDGLFR